jgi:hypothetical protein
VPNTRADACADACSNPETDARPDTITDTITDAGCWFTVQRIRGLHAVRQLGLDRPVLPILRIELSRCRQFLLVDIKHRNGRLLPDADVCIDAACDACVTQHNANTVTNASLKRRFDVGDNVSKHS